jgi:GDSL-like Lipase/Acylhydrolase family
VRQRLRRWWLPAVFVAVSLGVLTVSAARRSLLGALLGSVLLLASSLWWQHRLRQHPAAAAERWRRLIVPGLLVLTGVALLLARPLLGRTEGLGFIGFCLLFLGIGQLLIELRSRAWQPLRPGLLVAGLCAAAFLAGLIGFSTGFSRWALIAMAAGVLVSPIGLSLVTEGVARWRDPDGRPRRPRLAAAALGGVLVLVGTWWLAGTAAVDPRYSLILAAVLLLLVGAIATNTPVDVLLLIVVAAIVWASAPRGVAPTEPFLPDQGETVMVALGDSYISGEGAQRFFNGTNHKGRNECRRAPTAYAALAVVSNSDAVPDDLAFVACSGAEGRHIYEQPQHPGEPVGRSEGGLDQLRHLDWLGEGKDLEIALIIVSIGGNEALFGEIGRSCVGPGDCSEIGAKWLRNLDQVRFSLDQTYQRIRDHVGTGTPVLVVPYPIPLNPEGCDSSLLTPTEHRFINRFVVQLDRVLADAAAEAGLYHLGEMSTALEQERLRICDRETQVGVNFIGANPVEGHLDENVNPRNWFHNSLHPNERGHLAMRETLTQWLDRRPEITANRRDPVGAQDNGPPGTPSLEQMMGDPNFRHCDSQSSRPAHCGGGVRHWLAGQVADLTWRSLGPLALIIAGSWVLWLQGIRAWRRHRRAPRQREVRGVRPVGVAGA